MKHEIRRYPVKSPILKNYIKFFWEIEVDQLQLNHKLIPLRNIDLKFNLSDTPYYINANGKQQKLESVFFSGLHDHFSNYKMQLYGKSHMLGVCFLPEGFFPFLKIPVAEFKNQLLGAKEVGFKAGNEIQERLKEAPNIETRLSILENQLISLLDNSKDTPDMFRQVFNALKQKKNPVSISEFSQNHSISLRKLERMYNKYVGVSAKTYGTINRFQSSISQLLYSDYEKLSDVAYCNGYFDQMHFIKEFKKFAGSTPKNFLNKNESILQVAKFA